ncbi:MAG TPA: 30S ribosomal protein S20 [Actinomycetota bacterium]|jgi:small subunit ribosomal protein S20
MANIKSQIKRIRTNEAARNRNRSVRSALRTYVKRVHVALEAGDLDEAEVALRRAGKEIDKAASKGVLHPNSAANHKSRLAKRVAAARDFLAS